MEPLKVLVTGASGLLGRAIVNHFRLDPRWAVIGAAFSRAADGLIRLDVRDAAAVVSWEIHVVSQRELLLVHMTQHDVLTWCRTPSSQNCGRLL
jgi:uncharacterized protein YbjT (DUF2867 family)